MINYNESEVVFTVSIDGFKTYFMISASTLEKLDKAGIACFLKKADGSYSFVNHSGEEMLGLKASEILGRRDFDLFDVGQLVSMMKEDQGFWRESLGGGEIGLSIIDADPTPEQMKVLDLMRTIVTEGGDEIIAQIELLSGLQVLH